MNLTKALRKQFLDDVMAGIPRKHHYNKDDALNEIRNAIEAQLPNEVTDFAKKYPQLVRRDNYFRIEGLAYNWFTDKGYSRTTIPSVYTFDHPDAKMVDVSPWVKRKAAYDTEQEQRYEIYKRIEEIAASCNTLKQLKAALPELESYMPAEVEKKRNLPVAAGTIVTDLLAAGLKVPK